MNRRPFACLLPLALLAAVPARAQIDPALSRGHLAVLDFKNKLSASDKQEVDATYFADVVRSAALRTVPTLQVITRENLIVLLTSTGKKLEECEGECEVDTGRRIGADLVISGDLLKIGTNFKLNLRLHETHGGQLVSGAVAAGKTVDDLDANTNEAVTTLLAPLRAAPTALPPAVTRTTPEERVAAADKGKALAATAPAPTPVAPAPAKTSSLRTVGWVLAGVGVLAGAGSGLFALKGKGLVSNIQSGGYATGADIAKAASDSKATNGPAIGLAAGGAVALIAGVILIFTHPPAPESF